MEWDNLETCTLCRNCKLNRKRRSKSQGRDRNRYATSPVKTLPCLYLVNILTSPPPKKKFIVDNLTISHMNQSLEKRWNFNSRVKKTKQRKTFQHFLYRRESLEAKAQAAALHKQYEILSKSARKRERHAAATVIQCFWRMYMGKKAAQATRKDKRTREDAASKIQKFVRAWLALLHLRKYLASIVFVQKLTRGRNARIKIWKDEYYHKFHESVWSIVPEAKRLSRILQICSILRKLEREVVDDAVGILSGGVNGLYSLRDFGAETKASTESDRKTVARFHQLHFAFSNTLSSEKNYVAHAQEPRRC